jgi:uncharacterized membrane protein
MSQLIAIGFRQNMHRAAEVLNKLTAMNNDRGVDLGDAVAIYRDDEGKLRLDESYRMTTGQGAAWGAFWGSLVAALIAVPLTGGVSGAVFVGTIAAGAVGGALNADWWKHEFGLPHEFVKGVGGMVLSGDSAIIALLSASDPAYVEEEFRGYGGTVLKTTLTAEQSARLESVLRDGVEHKRR